MTIDDAEIIQFNDDKDNIYPVRDKKDFDVRTTSQTADVMQGLDLDELVSRDEIYGDGAEDLSYAVMEHNAEILAEVDFDISKVRKINIPVLEDF